MSYNRGAVVLVPFPFTDLSAIKQRPALIVSPDAWNATQSDVVPCAITSQLMAPPAGGDLLISSADLPACGLPKPSLVRTTKIFTMHQGLLRRTLGRLPDTTLQRTLAELRRFLA
jgi:mRNA interferase MazF